MLIGITGKKFHGKDTIANIIRNAYPSYTKYSMALPIKNVGKSLGFTYREMYDPAFKEIVNASLGISFREFATKFGTDFMRETFGVDIWIKRLEMYLSSTRIRNLVIPDIRFDNEAEYIVNNGGIIVMVENPRVQLPVLSQSHVSEAGVNLKYVSITFLNDGDVKHLKEEVLSFFKYPRQPESFKTIGV